MATKWLRRGWINSICATGGIGVAIAYRSRRKFASCQSSQASEPPSKGRDATLKAARFIDCRKATDMRELTTIRDIAAICEDRQIIYVGEVHDHDLTHHLQEELLTAITTTWGPFSLCLEQFERDVQPVIEDYSQGHISLDNLLNDGRAWPNYTRAYQPLVEHAIRHDGCRVVAANCPKRYLSLIRQVGVAKAIEQVSVPAKDWLPLAAPSWLPSAPYRSKFFTFMTGQGPDELEDAARVAKIDGMMQVQLAWDATMARTLLEQVDAGRQAMLICGKFHSEHYLGVPEQVKRMQPEATSLNIVILPVERAVLDAPLEDLAYLGNMADIVILALDDDVDEA